MADVSDFSLSIEVEPFKGQWLVTVHLTHIETATPYVAIKVVEDPAQIVTHLGVMVSSCLRKFNDGELPFTV